MSRKWKNWYQNAGAVIVVKFAQLNFKFTSKEFEKVQDVINFEKARDPHSVTAVIRIRIIIIIIYINTFI